MLTRIGVVGDVMAGENISHYNRGIRTKFGFNYSDIILPEIKAILFDDLDYLFFNFEYSLVDENFSYRNLYDSIYSASISSLDIFPAKLPKIVNIANNHFSQHGVSRADYTIGVLRDKGYIIVGENAGPTIIHKRDNRILFWGVSLIPENKYCGKYFRSSYSSLISDLSIPREKNKGDFWLISIHWGKEYCKIPCSEQGCLATRLVSMGFDAIIGHHPHVIQPIYKINNSFIINSLGNFIFDQNFSTDTQSGLVVKVELSTEELFIDKVYRTRQEEYRVIECEFQENASIIKDRNIFMKKWFIGVIQYWYRTKMKIEWLKSWNDIDSQFVRYLKMRFLVKYIRKCQRWFKVMFY